MHKLIICLLEVLPYSYDQDSTKERKLCSRYLHPILQTLFDDLHSENPVAFDFTDELNEECKSNISLTHERPDGHIYSCTNKMETLGYVEVKGQSALNNHYLINLDLARLGIFCKNALDIHGGQGKIAIQAVGVNITFYLVQRLNQYMYSMVELDFLQFPKSFEELRSLFAHMDNIMNTLQIFHKQCTPTTKEDLYDNVSDTLKSPILRAISNAK